VGALACLSLDPSHPLIVLSSHELLRSSNSGSLFQHCSCTHRLIDSNAPIIACSMCSVVRMVHVTWPRNTLGGSCALSLDLSLSTSLDLSRPLSTSLDLSTSLSTSDHRPLTLLDVCVAACLYFAPSLELSVSHTFPLSPPYCSIALLNSSTHHSRSSSHYFTHTHTHIYIYISLELFSLSLSFRITASKCCALSCTKRTKSIR
jgi:hypothetical protein